MTFEGDDGERRSKSALSDSLIDALARNGEPATARDWLSGAHLASAAPFPTSR
jgi:hypothetical protein